MFPVATGLLSWKLVLRFQFCDFVSNNPGLRPAEGPAAWQPHLHRRGEWNHSRVQALLPPAPAPVAADKGFGRERGRRARQVLERERWAIRSSGLRCSVHFLFYISTAQQQGRLFTVVPRNKVAEISCRQVECLSLSAHITQQSCLFCKFSSWGGTSQNQPSCSSSSLCAPTLALLEQ